METNLLRQYVAKLNRVLANRVAPRDLAWTEQRCIDSRRIHLKVWKCEPDPAYVEDVIIHVLEKTCSAIIAAKANVPSTKRHKPAGFAKNVLVRIANLRRYIAGEDSAFDPGELNPRANPALRE